MESARGPSRDKLLPDWADLGYAFQPITLVVALEGNLTSKVWDVNYGWRTQLRPHTLDFLVECQNLGYEVVIVSSQPFLYSAEVIEKLQVLVGKRLGLSEEEAQQTPIFNVLFRDSLYRDTDGSLLKDISKLNRDPARVIFVDSSVRAVSLQPENAIVLPEFDPSGESSRNSSGAASSSEGDEALGKVLQNFLHEIQRQNVKDVRPILRSRKKGHDDTAPFDLGSWERVMRKVAQRSVERKGTLMGMMQGAAQQQLLQQQQLQLQQEQAQQQQQEQQQREKGGQAEGNGSSGKGSGGVLGWFGL